MPQCVGLSRRFSGRATLRGELAPKRKHIIPAKAREHQSHGQTAPGKTLLENSPKAFTPINTRAEIAKIAGVSDNTIARVHESGRCTLPFRTFGEFSKSPPYQGARVGPLHHAPLGAETSRADLLEEVRGGVTPSTGVLQVAQPS